MSTVRFHSSAVNCSSFTSWQQITNHICQIKQDETQHKQKTQQQRCSKKQCNTVKWNYFPGVQIQLTICFASQTGSWMENWDQLLHLDTYPWKPEKYTHRKKKKKKKARRIQICLSLVALLFFEYAEVESLSLTHSIIIWIWCRKTLELFVFS